MAVRVDYTILNALSDFLSVVTILTCFVLKIPQIIRIFKVKNADGINVVGLLLELTSYTITFSYNYRNGYALLSYMEYPIILVQELVLIYTVLYYKKYLNLFSLSGACVYFSIAAGFLLGVVPKDVLTFLVPLCTPIGASSKAVQLFEIISKKHAESVSLLTWLISAFTNLTRIFTIFMDSADSVLLLNFTVNFLLSSSIMISAYIYKFPTPDKQVKQE